MVSTLALVLPRRWRTRHQTQTALALAAPFVLDYLLVSGTRATSGSRNYRFCVFGFTQQFLGGIRLEVLPAGLGRLHRAAPERMHFHFWWNGRCINTCLSLQNGQLCLWDIVRHYCLFYYQLLARHPSHKGGAALDKSIHDISDDRGLFVGQFRAGVGRRFMGSSCPYRGSYSAGNRISVRR